MSSVYFDYPHYSFERPAELDGAERRYPVVIVGAGPVGLACALELARHGVGSIVVDPKDSVCEGSRAVCIARRSMEILQQLGVAERFESKGLGWTHGHSFYRDKLVYVLEMPHSEQERYLPMYNLQQQYIEQFLVEHAAAQPAIEVRWQSRLTELAQNAQGVNLTIDTPDGSYNLRADYVVAADGARSTVRELLDLKLAGDAYEGRYAIVDIKMRSDYPTGRRAFFDPPANPGSTLLIHKQPDDIWRLDYQLRDDEDADAALEEARVTEQIQSILDMVGEKAPWTLQWRSIYKAYTLALDDYRLGRLLFAGDAAHLVPIFGVRGLNSGIADANNLGWKLAYVLHDWAPERLLDSYTPERREATLDIFRAASKSTRFMTPPTRGYQLLRDAALSLSINHAFAREFVNPRQSAPYDYTASPLTSHPARCAEFNAGPRAGAPFQNASVDKDGYLFDYLGKGFSGVYFVAEATDATPHLQLFESLSVGDEAFTALVVARQAATRKFRAARIIMDHDGDIFAAYGAQPGSFYLIRPDGHIAARWPSIAADEVRAAYAAALSR